ncbi:MAG: phage baseplate assembly protein V [Gammaproteobacteria bacterium]
MSPALPVLDRDEGDASAFRVTGVVIGIVTNNKDPDSLGRVKVKFPWLSDSDESAWARVAAPMAGKDRGFYFLPEIDDEVLVVFEHGDMRFPYVLGALWNGKDKPPATNDDGKNAVRLIKSHSGHTIRLTDKADEEKIEIIDKSGNNKLVIDTATNTISLTTDKDLKLSAAKGRITLSAQTIVIEAQSKLEMKSSATADIKASGPLNIKGAVVNLN